LKHILERLERLSETEPNSGCWLWTGYIDPQGYGRLGNDGLAHRLMYELVRGPIPAGLTLDHLCRVRSCINPNHLEPVTDGVNILRGTSFSAINARKTACPYGHAYREAKTNGRRVCRECNRLAATAYRIRMIRLVPPPGRRADEDHKEDLHA
jgi:hypothetical protein